MSVTTLLQTLEEADIQLWVEGDALRFRAPRGALTDDLRAQVSGLRQELIEELRDGDGVAGVLCREPDAATEPFPLTDIQAAYAVGRSDVYEHGGVGCHGYTEFDIDLEQLGPDPARTLSEAWDRVVECHPMLRAVIHVEGWQRVDPRLEVPLVVRPSRERDDVRRLLRDKVYRIETEGTSSGVEPMVDVVVTMDPPDGRDAVLHFSVDLLITDFAGISVILADFAKALRGEPLEVPSLTFRDYQLTMRRRRQSAQYRRERERATAFWEQAALNLPDPMTLSPEVTHPSDPAPGVSQKVRFTRRTHLLDIDARRRLESLSHTAGVTTTSLVMATLGRVLHRHGAPERGIVAMTMLDREPITEDVDRVVGDFTATVFVEVDARGGRSITELARETHHSIFDALDHKAVAGSELAALVGKQRSGGVLRAPIVVTSTIGMVDKPLGDVLRPRAGVGISQTPQVLLDVQLSPAADGGLQIDWDNRDGGFAASVLDAAFADFRQVLEEICAHGLSEADPVVRRPLPGVVRATTRRDDDRDAMLHGPLLQQCLADPQAPAIDRPSDTVTRGQLLAAALVVRDDLQARKPRPERVAISVSGVAEAIAVQLGALLSGCSYVPLDPEWPDGRVEAILRTLRENGSATYVDDTDALLDAVRTALVEPTSAPEASDLLGACDPQAEAYVIFTSGSTGVPKGVRISHEQARTTLADLEKRLDLGAKDAVLAVSRQSFDLSVFNTFGLLGVGGRVVLPAREATTDPTLWLNRMREAAVTVWNSVPAQLQLLLDELERESGSRLAALRVVMVSGDWVPVQQPSLVWRHAPGARFLSLGGATEAAIWSVVHEVLEAQPADSRSIPYGRALTGQGIWVVNDDDEPATVLQEGDIVIGGDGVALGYLGDDAATEAAFFVDDVTGERCYRTGDRGRLLPDGEIEFLGRRDGQVKIAGHRIELGEIESALEACSGVARALAVVSDAEEGLAGTQLVAAVVPERSSDHERRHLQAAAACTRRITDSDAAFIEDLDAPAVRELADLVAESATEHMAEQLARFPRATVPELVSGLHAHAHADLVGRWVTFLQECGWARVENDRVDVTTRLNAQRDEARWQRIAQLDASVGYGAEQLAYVRRCLEDLPSLLDGSVDPLALLFPGGSTQTAVAAYGENLFARWINTAAAAGVSERARQNISQGRPLRILEIGGGVGGTTTPVLEALTRVCGPGLEGVEYLFTDVSHYFFDEITRQWPQVRTTLFDLNVEPWEQGIASGTFDVVLCANVLHNSVNLPQALERISGLLVPGGALVVLDSTSANAPLLASMEFKEGLSGFTDVRAESGRPFLSLEQWLHEWEAGPFVLQGRWPQREDHVMSVGSQHLFWATNTPDAAALDVPTLCSQVARVLPRAMVPRTLTVMPAIPLTSNGKMDRRAVARRAVVERPTGRCVEAGAALTEAQEHIAEIWREVLELGSEGGLSPMSDFFDLGGDSLLLARCVGRLRQEIDGAHEVPWDDVMRRMVADPTLEGCAAALSRGDSAGQVSSGSRDGDISSLVDLLPASGLDEDVLVLVHDGSGGLGPYQDVLRALERAPRRPRVVGLRRRPGDDYLQQAPEALLDALAERYTHEVLQLDSPRVHLFGYCMGGLIAAAIALRCAESDRPVTQCTVVSSYRIPFRVEDDLLLDYSLAKLLHHDPADVGLGVDDEALGQALTQVRGRSPQVIPAGAVLEAAEPTLAQALTAAPPTVAERLEHLAASGPQGAWTTSTLRDLRQVFQHSLDAVACWEAPAYLGDIRFLRQRGDLHFLPTLQEDMTSFWQDFCLGDLEIVDIDGTHFDCLTGERADAVVDLLAQGWVS